MSEYADSILDVEEDVEEVVPPRPWAERAHKEWGIRWEHKGNAPIILISRYADENGKDSRGDESTWDDIATIISLSDAEEILRALRANQ